MPRRPGKSFAELATLAGPTPTTLIYIEQTGVIVRVPDERVTFSIFDEPEPFLEIYPDDTVVVTLSKDGRDTGLLLTRALLNVPTEVVGVRRGRLHWQHRVFDLSVAIDAVGNIMTDKQLGLSS